MFSKRLKELREERHLTQKELSQKLNVSQTTVAKWEAGDREPCFDMLVKLADFFECSADYFLGRKDF